MEPNHIAHLVVRINHDFSLTADLAATLDARAKSFLRSVVASSVHQKARIKYLLLELTQRRAGANEDFVLCTLCVSLPSITTLVFAEHYLRRLQKKKKREKNTQSQTKYSRLSVFVYFKI